MMRQHNLKNMKFRYSEFKNWNLKIANWKFSTLFL